MIQVQPDFSVDGPAPTHRLRRNSATRIRQTYSDHSIRCAPAITLAAVAMGEFQGRLEHVVLPELRVGPVDAQQFRQFNQKGSKRGTVGKAINQAQPHTNMA